MNICHYLSLSTIALLWFYCSHAGVLKVHNLLVNGKPPTLGHYSAFWSFRVLCSFTGSTSCYLLHQKPSDIPSNSTSQLYQLSGSGCSQHWRAGRHGCWNPSFSWCWWWGKFGIQQPNVRGVGMELMVKTIELGNQKHAEQAGSFWRTGF